ncbi:hypothetical protein EB001_09935 [bacterium]|nr:hypothetical protein [bacterium]
MIIPSKVSGGVLTQDTTTTNLTFNRMNQDVSIRASAEVFFEYNMNEYGETTTETVSVSNYDLETQVDITGVSANGLTITYTANNSFQPGDVVTIIGVSPSVFNLNQVVVASSTSTYFSINNTTTGTYSSGGKASKKADYYPVENVSGLPFKKLFPIDTIKNPMRPASSGIKYAIIGDLDKISNSPNYSNPKALEYGYDMISKHRVYYPGEDVYYKYWVGGRGKGIDLRLKYPKTILTNKIVIKFELSHSTPATFNVYLSNSTTPIFSGTSADIPYTTDTEGINKGLVELYYNGSSWSTNQVWSAPTPLSITDVRVTATKEVNSIDKFIGIIEIAPMWRKQIFDEVVSLNITKDSSSGSEEYLPVGRISANSLQLSLFSPALSSSEYVSSFDKSQELESWKLYFSKNMIIKPYLILSEITGTEQLIAKQGTFYLDTWTINEYGEISISARDGAKILQERSASPILCKNYTAPGIIRNLLDSIGFTNYKFNFRREWSPGVITTQYGSIKEDETITPQYWWTDSNKSAWDALSEICRDTQLTAFFDENNVLQFYTKAALFDPNRKQLPEDTSSIMWEFRNATESVSSINITGATTDLPDPLPNHPATVDKVKFIYTAVNTFKQGDIVTISGIVNSIYNISNAVVIAANSTTFTIYKDGSSTGTGSSMSTPFPNLLWGGGGTVTKNPDLANIISFDKEEKKSTNRVKVIYYSTYGSEYDLEQSKQPLWSSQGTQYIGAGALRTSLPAIQTTGFVELDSIADSSLISQSIISYSGYLALGSEIIEFDGVEYSYISLETESKVTTVVKSKSDLEQIISLSKPTTENDKKIKPTGRYKIKTRGAFGTTPVTHIVDASSIIQSWQTLVVNWQ